MILGTTDHERFIYGLKETYYFYKDNKKILNTRFQKIHNSKMKNRNGLIIVPNVYWEQRENFWGPGNGNIYYEIWQSAIECENLEEITIYKVNLQNDSWHLDVIDLISKNDISFILMDVEQNPSGSSKWDLDLKIQFIRKYWQGKIFLFSLDMAFITHLKKAAKIIKNDANSIVISIDRDLRRFYSTRGIGPLLAPISIKSINFLDKAVNVPVKKKYNLTFIGALYKQREKVLQEIIDYGIPLTINPNQKANDRSSYVDYIKTLMESKFTLNLSKAGRDPVSQIKSRILESTVFGTKVVTDSKNNIAGVLPLKSGIIRIESLNELLLLTTTDGESDRVRDREEQETIQNEARIHATRNFWTTLLKYYF